MKCFKCKHVNPEGAKFCANCGTQIALIGKVCPKCQAISSLSANYCKACGTKLTDSVEQQQPEDEYNVFMNNRHVTWKILPGQLAVKIDEQEMANYKFIKGVYVAPGTTALFFVNGRYSATLESGTYSFDDYTTDESPQSGPVLSFIKKIARHILNGDILHGGNPLFGGDRSNIDAHGNKVFYSVVLIKDANFPLIYEFKNVATKNLRSDVGLHMLCQISNLNNFFADQLTDKKFVAIDSLSESIKGIVTTATNQVLSAYSPEDIYSNNALVSDTVLAALQAKVSAVYPYISIQHIINLSAQQKDIEQIRALKEKLYISELELTQLQAQNDIKNKLQNEDNRTALRDARTQTDFEAAMDKIDQEKLLNQNSRDQFKLALDAERTLREARTSNETDAALRQLMQTDLLGREELQNLEAQIKQRLAISTLDNEHSLTKKQKLNQMELDGQQLDWDIAIGNKRLENDIWRQRQQLLATLDAKKAEYEFDKQVADDIIARERSARDFDAGMTERSAQFAHDLEKDKNAQKMEMLRQAEALRREREAQTHQNEMDKINAENAVKMAAIQADYDYKRAELTAYAGMTAEQIMAANPNISPEAAKAFAEKYKAEGAVAQNNVAIQMMKDQQEKLEAVYAKSAQDMKDIAMGQMQLSRDIAQMQNSFGAQRFADKEAEAQRIREDAEGHQDRMIDGVKTTVDAMGNAKMSVPYVINNTATPSGVMMFCTQCGENCKSGIAKCPKCGHVFH